MEQIGARLREARMGAKIDINQVESDTKIRAKYLRAMENEEWSLLPGEIYSKTFLRTYADYLGLDSRMLLDEFRRRYERPNDPDARPIAALGRERERASRGPRRPRVPGWLVIAVILVGVAGALFAIGELTGNGPSTPPLANGGARTRHHHRGHAKTTTTLTTASTPTKTVTTPAPPKLASLRITPTGTVWICVERVVHGVGKPVFPAGDFTLGQTVPSVRGRELLVTLGNAGATLEVDGKPYPLTASNQAIGLRVTPTRVSALAPGTQATCT